MKKRTIAALLLCALTLITSISLSGCAGRKSEPQYITSIDQLKEARIGVQTGTVFDVMAKDALPDCTIEYFNLNSDILAALDSGKVSAYICDESVANQVIRNNNSYSILDVLAEDTYGLAFPKSSARSNELCKQLNKFMAKIRSDGTLEEISGIWFGSDDTKKDIDYSVLTGENGVLQLAVSSEGTEPFAYVKNNKIIGYDLDIAARFCLEYGYGLKITDYTFDGLLAAISSGKADFGAGSISITEERKESMLFSDPNYDARVVIVVKSPEILYSSFDDLTGKRAGVISGGISDQIIEKHFPGADIQYFNSASDLAVALDAGKIDYYILNDLSAQPLIAQYSNQMLLGIVEEDHFGAIFPKNSEKGTLLCSQMNQFIAKHKADGKIDAIIEKWLKPDSVNQTISFDDLTGENGTLRYAVSTDVGMPYTYVQNGQLVGYEVDIAVEFCREYGYKIEISNSSFTGMIAAVSSGKCDFGSSGISITEERKSSMLISDPTYDGGMAIVVKKYKNPSNNNSVIRSIDDLNGKRGGILTGGITDRVLEERFDKVQLEYYNSSSELSVALNTNKIDYYAINKPTAVYMAAQDPGQTVLGTLMDDHYGVIFPKNAEKSPLLCRQMNEFIAKHKADGALDSIINGWMDPGASERSIEYDDLSAENGILTFALSTNYGAPFAFMQNGKYAGYEVEIAVEFCREYGYGIKFFDTTFAGMIAAVSSGKCDFGASGISITDERKQSMLISDPTCDGGVAVVVKKDNFTATSDGSFWDSVAESFEKTFIREDRWKLFLSGIGLTLLITVLSAIFGSILGFALFLIYRKGNKIFVSITDTVGYILEKLPVVVILMILYYLIFGSLDISNVIVSTICFTLLFTFSVIGLLKVGVGAIDKGQTEAALALGYTDNQAFLKIIFPQAVKHFMPGYKGAIVSLIKDTAIVGYIAVQDLTKISDIVRSRTYEAFFPLIATAMIYFTLAVILIFIVKHIQIGSDPRHRKAEKILKDVKTSR